MILKVSTYVSAYLVIQRSLCYKKKEGCKNNIAYMLKLNSKNSRKYEKLGQINLILVGLEEEVSSKIM